MVTFKSLKESSYKNSKANSKFQILDETSDPSLSMSSLFVFLFLLFIFASFLS